MKEPTTEEGPSVDDRAESKDGPAEMAAKAIREKSAAGQLVSESDVLSLLKDNHLISPGGDKTGDNATAILAQLLRKNDDLRELTGAGSRYYYSSLSMTETYATILLHKLEGPMRLIAETVRQSACEYERPVPLSMFSEPPFDLPYHQALDYVGTMAKTEGYEDIAATGTSTSAIYLYSTSYLEAEHAAMLAEWFDVGQSESA